MTTFGYVQIVFSSVIAAIAAALSTISICEIVGGVEIKRFFGSEDRSNGVSLMYMFLGLVIFIIEIYAIVTFSQIEKKEPALSETEQNRVNDRAKELLQKAIDNN